jgi:hypothetical protein
MSSKGRATVVTDAIAVVAHRAHGETILETECLDYTAYTKLPQVVTYEHTMYVKTGWSSDTGRACYKVGGLKEVAYARA